MVEDSKEIYVGGRDKTNSFSLERVISLLAVHEHLTRNHSHSRSTGQNIKKSSLPSTRDALELLLAYLLLNKTVTTLTISAVSVPGLTQPSTLSRILRVSLLILTS